MTKVTAPKVLDDALGHIQAGWIQGDYFEVEAPRKNFWSGVVETQRFQTGDIPDTDDTDTKIVGVCSLGGLSLAMHFEGSTALPNSRLQDKAYGKALRALYQAITKKKAPTKAERAEQRRIEDGVSKDNPWYDPQDYVVDDEELFEFMEEAVALFNDDDDTTRRKVINRFKKARQLISEGVVR